MRDVCELEVDCLFEPQGRTCPARTSIAHLHPIMRPFIGTTRQRNITPSGEGHQNLPGVRRHQGDWGGRGTDSGRLAGYDSAIRSANLNGYRLRCEGHNSLCLTSIVQYTNGQTENRIAKIVIDDSIGNFQRKVSQRHRCAGSDRQRKHRGL